MADPTRLAQLRDTVLAHGHLRLPDPVELSSGAMSRDFVDGKRALARGADLRLACECMVDALAEAGIEFDAVGGLTMGADQFAHGVALVADTLWFVVRKEPKGRGTNKLVEGAELGPGVRVVVVEDVVSTGASLLRAVDAVRAEGAEVVAVVTLVDRGEACAPELAGRGLPYLPLLTYRDLDIDPLVAPGS